MIGRPAFVEAVQAQGLVIETPNGEVRAPVTITSKMSGAAEADVVLFCVKTSDNSVAAQELAGVLKPQAQVLSLQNGVDNVEQIRKASGIQALPAVVYVAASVVAPGRIRHLGRGDLVVGREARDLAHVFTRAEVPCRISDDLGAELWTKLATNCALNAISALARIPYAKIIGETNGRALVCALVDEVFAVARASGITAPDFNQKSLREAAFSLAQQMPATFSSTAQDLERGKKTEIDSLNGFVARRASELHLLAPLNDALAHLVRLAEKNAK